MVRKAHDLAVADQVAVDVRPPLAGSDVHQRVLRLLRGLGVHEPHEVGDAVDVGVHAHRRDVHRVGADAGGGLAADHGQAAELVGVLRDIPAELVAEHPAAVHDGLPLLLREPRRTDELRDDVRIGVGYRVYRIVPAEQVVRGAAGVVVAGALRQYRRYQDVERVGGPLGVQSLRVAARIRSAQVLL